MAARKLPPEVQSIFDKYTKSAINRRLKKADALEMFEKEFHLSPQRAEEMFYHFDTDRNGYMSLWEFVHFYKVIGQSAEEMVQKFDEMDTDKNGYLDMNEARKGLKTLKTADGSTLDENEIDFFLKTASRDDQKLDLGEFANLLARLKVYKKP